LLKSIAQTVFNFNFLEALFCTLEPPFKYSFNRIR